MAKKRISEAQAKKIVAEVEAGAKPGDLAKKYGFSLGTYYNWRAKFGGKSPEQSTSKAAPKKAVASKAAPKKAVASKAAPKKRGPKKATKGSASSKRGSKTATKAAVSAPQKGSAAAIKSQINGLQVQIKSIEEKIATLKMAYADAVFG